jgi:signal transduction histidine kinase
VLAQYPQNNSLIGKTYTSPNPSSEIVLQRAYKGDLAPLDLYSIQPDGSYWMAIPISEGNITSPLVGVLVLSIAPPPPLIWSLLPFLLGTVFVTGILLLVAVAPFGALFGWFMSRGLTRRLASLSTAADAWSEGNFSVLPQDTSSDEISSLGTRLRHMAERVQELLRSQQELAMMQERNRLARELHDTVKQQNFATLMQIRAARNLLTGDTAAASEALQEAERLIKTSQQELGLMIGELRPAALEEQGIVRALENYVETWSRQAHISATFHSTTAAQLSAEAAQALYRVAQEALSNVARHSNANAVTVTLAQDANAIVLTISDNGVGFDVNQAQGVGLSSMQERLTLLEGTLQVKSERGSGTTVTARVPAGES